MNYRVHPYIEKRQNNHSGYSGLDRLHGRYKTYTVPISSERTPRVGGNCKGGDGTGDKENKVVDIFKAHATHSK